MGQCTWVEDVDGENAGYPIFGLLDPNRVDEIVESPFQVYPNPTNGILFVETRRATSLPAANEYRITNLLGQVLQTGSIGDVIEHHFDVFAAFVKAIDNTRKLE